MRTDAGAAACAQAWYEGAGQTEIAWVFGYSAQTQVCIAIAEFINKYTGAWPPPSQYHRGARKRLIPEAIARYKAQRGAPGGVRTV